MADHTVDLWALDEVHFQQQGSRCRMWVPPETNDPIVYHHPTRKSVGYFAAVRLRDGKFLFRREIGRFNGQTFWEGDGVVVHELRGRAFNRKIDAQSQAPALQILQQPEWHDFGPAFAHEQLAKRHPIQVSEETLRGWMIGAGLWQSRSRQLEAVHGGGPDGAPLASE